METLSSDTIFHYHERTKHHINRHARSPGHMDWENQPDPFRTYQGADTVPLPLLDRDPPVGHAGLYVRRRSDPAALARAPIAGFLELSMGLSAWKAMGMNRWALRINPSSGNLHPTEIHLVLPDMDGLAGGTYHYRPMDHTLELRAAVPGTLWQAIDRHFGGKGFLVGLSSIFWRESWKYGERAFRYCNLDAGHALAALSFSAALQGWHATCLNAVADRQIETVLGFDQTDWHPGEREHPDLLCFVSRHERPDIPLNLPREVVSGFAGLDYGGKPNRLSAEHVEWPVIEQAAQHARKPETNENHPLLREHAFYSDDTSVLTAAQIIRRRRSATDYHREASMERKRFLTLLDKTVPRAKNPPFDIGLAGPAVHLLIFVHRVKEMQPGLYFLLRNQREMDRIRSRTRTEFSWARETDRIPLYRLRDGDYRMKALEVSCHQEIAGFGVFSLGMIANFRQAVEEEPFRYRHLFRECGMIGQVLYLEAEAAGMRGTGIGCFFDDEVHELMGLRDNTYQSLYHFTVGAPVEDPRLTTHPPYSHLDK